MKRIVRQTALLLLILACLFPGNSFSQNVTGIWKGHFTSENGQQYRLEFQVKQNKDGTISSKKEMGMSGGRKSSKRLVFIAKLDNLGNWQWAKHAGSQYYDEGIALTVDNSNNAIVTGYFQESAIFENSNITTSSTYEGVFIASYSNIGTLNWLRSNNDSTNYNLVDGYGICSKNGNIYVTGVFDGKPKFGPYLIIGMGDVFILKIRNSVVGIEEFQTDKYFSIYPNPTSDVLNINSQAIENSNYKIVITNTLGETVKQKEIKVQTHILQLQLDLSELHIGFYFLSIFSEKHRQVFKVQKL